MIRGTGCPSWARPDLWEARAGTRPGPPGVRVSVAVRVLAHADRAAALLHGLVKKYS
jgi:hypothetical protein